MWYYQARLPVGHIFDHTHIIDLDEIDCKELVTLLSVDELKAGLLKSSITGSLKHLQGKKVGWNLERSICSRDNSCVNRGKNWSISSSKDPTQCKNEYASLQTDSVSRP